MQPKPTIVCFELPEDEFVALGRVLATTALITNYPQIVKVIDDQVDQRILIMLMLELLEDKRDENSPTCRLIHRLREISENLNNTANC